MLVNVLRPFLLLLLVGVVSAAQTINHPELNFKKIGGRLTLLGSYDSISFYSKANATSSLSLTPQKEDPEPNKLFLRNSTDNTVENFAVVDGDLTSVQVLGSTTVLINGGFTSFNNKTCKPPIIYNITSKEISNLIPDTAINAKRDVDKKDLPHLDGNVKTTFIDGELIYMGGEFTYGNSSGVVVYNQTSKEISELPFRGFGKNASIEAITKLESKDDSTDVGSIVFGGKFNTLGIPDLLLHNISYLNITKDHRNYTNTSLITAEQKISLIHGSFSDVNGDGSNPAELVCPSKSALWAPQDNSGGQWLVDLPAPMKGIVPTKVRLYVPDSEDSINTFRIYSYPNQGIMNLTYIDPETNDLKHCDASCPLAAFKQLKEATSNNLDEIADWDGVEDVFIGEEDGTFSMYYDPSTHTKSLSYAKNFQEFAFENDVGIDQVGLTVIAWNGNKGAVAGFELYTNEIYVYSNNTLNEPNCGEDPDKLNSFDVDQGNFQSITTLRPGLSTDYSVSTGTDGKVTLYPNVTYSGDYSIIVLTPGCIQDNSCDLRSIVTVTLYDTNGTALASKDIWQNNDYDKYDYLFYGHLEGSTLSQGQNRIEMTYNRPIIENTEEPWMVIDRIRADIVDLDHYFDKNSTNRTKDHNETEYYLAELKLSGLFEYSLANFTYFDEELMYGETEDEISPYNLFVGNSTINLLSAELSNSSSVSQFNLDDESLLILGNFESDSKNLTLKNDNLIRLKLESYNTTSNSSISEIQKRYDDYFTVNDDYEYSEERELFDAEMEDFDTTEYVSLSKRDGGELFGANFNNSVAKVANYYNARLLLGKFSMNNDDDSSVKIYDLSKDNKSVSSANNFVLYQGSDFYSFGNDYIDQSFSGFTNITIQGTEFFVFSNDETTMTWNNTGKQWISDSSRKLKISQALNLPDGRQIISGSSFSIMDNYLYNQAFISSNDDIGSGTFDQFDIDIDNGVFTNAYFINSSTSVLGGKFKTSGKSKINDVGFATTGKNFTSLQDKFSSTKNFTVQNLYVDPDEKYLVIGYNGTVEINGSELSGGILIYDLRTNDFTEFQPAELSSDDTLKVNSINLYNENDKLLIGGQFDMAGSLECQNICIYDIKNTRWESPNVVASGEITDAKFYTKAEVLIAGALSNKFTTYNVAKDRHEGINQLKNGLNTKGLSSGDVVRKLIMPDERYSDKLNGRFVAMGNNFIKGFDGEEWKDITGIDYDDDTVLTDIKLLVLEGTNKDNNESYFDNDKTLMVSGRFSLQDYGLVNVAMYTGSKWVPLAYTATSDNQLGTVNTILVEDQFRFLASEDVEPTGLSAGKIVGISLACALGSTVFLSLLYIIPYLILFRGKKEAETKERIGEKEMMDAVNPEDLFHEIDLQRHH